MKTNDRLIKLYSREFNLCFPGPPRPLQGFQEQLRRSEMYNWTFQHVGHGAKKGVVVFMLRTIHLAILALHAYMILST